MFNTRPHLPLALACERGEVCKIQLALLQTQVRIKKKKKTSRLLHLPHTLHCHYPIRALCQICTPSWGTRTFHYALQHCLPDLYRTRVIS